MIYTVEIQIEATDEAAAEIARDELTNSTQDAEDGGYVPHGTFSVGELKAPT